MPVMEGKGILFKYLGGVDAFPICLATTKDRGHHPGRASGSSRSSAASISRTSPSPSASASWTRSRKEMAIPVWHDDQQGTAAVTYAGLINALKVVGKKMTDVTIAMIGTGAANVAIASGDAHRWLPGREPDHGRHQGHPLPGQARPRSPVRTTRSGSCAEDHQQGDAQGRHRRGHEGRGRRASACPSPARARSSPSGSPAWPRTRSSSCAPTRFPRSGRGRPRKPARRIVATGRSDFPNQVNNSLGFPGIFRGTLDVRAKTITDEMCIAAAEELAKCAEDKGLPRGLHHPVDERVGGLPARGGGGGPEGDRAGRGPGEDDPRKSRSPRRKR